MKINATATDDHTNVNLVHLSMLKSTWSEVTAERRLPVRDWRLKKRTCQGGMLVTAKAVNFACRPGINDWRVVFGR